MILIVDDEPRNRSVLRGYLAGQHQVLEAGNGLSALEALEKNRVDLVLLDVLMPEMDGFETCRRIKAGPRDGYLPVLLLTMLSDQEDRNEGLEAGADEFLSKPIDPHELDLRVRSFLKLRAQDCLIRQQVEELRQAQSLKDDLFALVVHDLRNPLSSLHGYLALMRNHLDRGEGEQVGGYIDSARSSLERLQTLVDGILHVRLIEEGELEIAARSIRLGELVRRVAELLVGAGHSKNVNIRTSIEDDPEVMADENLIQRAAENLIINAVKYTRHDSAVEVRLHRDGPQLAIEVADRGPGIPEGLWGGVFEKYGSVEARDVSIRRGYGLGLHLVKIVVLAHQGTVSVRNREGGGTVFRVGLPLPA